MKTLRYTCKRCKSKVKMQVLMRPSERLCSLCWFVQSAARAEMVPLRDELRETIRVAKAKGQTGRERAARIQLHHLKERWAAGKQSRR